jgi:ABC-2 type transport system permease protein
MHNFSTVLQFELIRTLKKPSFWLSILAIPALTGVIFAIVFFANSTSINREEEVRNTPFSLTVQDQTNIISDATLSNLKATRAQDKETAIKDVRTGKIDAFFYYPEDLTKQPIEVYNKNDGLTDNAKYIDVAQSLIKASATTSVGSPQLLAIITDGTTTTQKNFENGSEANIIGRMIAPMVFLVVFYAVIVLLGGQMLTSTTEEKENRVTEMLLTSISSKALIIGKIFSLIILGFIQIAVIVIPAVLVYLFGKDTFNIPDMSNFLGSIQFEFWPIALGAAVLICGFLLFTGMLVAIGAAMPTAKEANGFFGIVITLMIVPFWFFPLLMSPASSTVVTGLTYFPFTAPFALLIRNGFNTLPLHEGIIGLIIVALSGIFAINIAVRIFRYGTLEYSNRLSLRTIFGNKKSA